MLVGIALEVKMTEFETSVKIIKELDEPTRFVLIKNGMVLGEQELTPGQNYRFTKLIEEIWGRDIHEK